MHDLLEIQSDFAAALRDRDATSRAGRWLAGDAAHVEQRVAIYRANMVASAAKALSAAYPVARQVVGEEFFHGLARAYQHETPSTSGDLTDFGAEFPAFLAGFEHTRSLPYLPDLARLEWAVHRAYGAADALPWDAAELAAVDPEQHEAIRFDWSAGTAVIDSPYPIARIWTIHQAAHDGEFAVDWNAPQCALVARDGFVVDVSHLAAGDAAFMAASLAGTALGPAVAEALRVGPMFDLGKLLARVIALGLVRGFSLIDPDEKT
jgi:hypothetical protein